MNLRSVRFITFAFVFALIFVLAACGSRQTGSTDGQDGGGGGGQSTTEQSSGEQYNLDLQTAAEVMEYVKDMDPETRHEVLYQGAKKRNNGTITLYTTMSENNTKQLHEAWDKRYPDLTLDVWRGDGNDQVQARTVNEFRAGTHKVDVIDNKFNFSYDLAQEGILTPYFSVHVGDYPKGLFDPEGMWMGLYAIPINLSWNTDLIDESELPKSWKDLADPKYEGNFSLDVQDNLVLFYWRKLYGEEEGTELARRIAANNPHLIRSRSQQAALLSAGEFAMSAAMYEHNAIQVIAKGAPVDFTYYEEPVLVDIEGTMLAKNAPNPYGAILLMDWQSSLEAQQVIADMGRVATHPGVTYENPRQGAVLRERELFELKPGDYGPVIEQTARDFGSIFGLTQ